MDILILTVVALNLLATLIVGKRVFSQQDVKVEILPFEFVNEDDKVEEVIPEPKVEEVIELFQPVSQTNDTGPWVNRKGIPWNETSKPAEPPKTVNQPGERPYGWV